MINWYGKPWPGSQGLLWPDLQGAPAHPGTSGVLPASQGVVETQRFPRAAPHNKLGKQGKLVLSDLGLGETSCARLPPPYFARPSSSCSKRRCCIWPSTGIGTAYTWSLIRLLTWSPLTFSLKKLRKCRLLDYLVQEVSGVDLELV